MERPFIATLLVAATAILIVPMMLWLAVTHAGPVAGAGAAVLALAAAAASIATIQSIRSGRM